MCYSVYLLFFGYALYNSTISGNILKDLALTHTDWKMWLGVAASMGMGFVVLTIYPLMVIPMVCTYESKKAKTLATIIVVILSVLVAYGGECATLNIICGAVGTIFFIGVVPAACNHFMLKGSKVMTVLLLIIGAAGILGVVYNKSKPAVGDGTESLFRIEDVTKAKKNAREFGKNRDDFEKLETSTCSWSTDVFEDKANDQKKTAFKTQYEVLDFFYTKVVQDQAVPRIATSQRELEDEWKKTDPATTTSANPKASSTTTDESTTNTTTGTETNDTETGNSN